MKLEETNIIKNVFQCKICGGIVDRHEFAFICRDCKAIGDFTTGIMTPNIKIKTEE